MNIGTYIQLSRLLDAPTYESLGARAGPGVFHSLLKALRSDQEE